MARYRYGGIADYAVTLGDENQATLQPGVGVTFWNSASAGTQYTDLVDVDGMTPIPDGELTTNAQGAVPEFFGPDGVRSMYYDASGGAGPRRRAAPTDVGDDLTTLEGDVATHTAADNPHGTAIATLADTSADPATADVKGGGLLTYDTLTSAWRPDGSTTALTGWHAALAARHYSRANVICLGDSITEGQGADDYSRTWPAMLREVLRTRFPTSGVDGGGRGFIGAAPAGVASFAWPATLTGGPTINDDWGPKRRTPQLDGDAPADLLTYSLQGTSANIMWTRSDFGGNFRWRVDGGVWTSVNTGGAAGDGFFTPVTLGASDPYTLEIESVDSGFQQFVSGVTEFDGDEDAGITVHDCGHSGWSSDNWSTFTGSNAWPSAVGTLLGAGGLVIIMLGANDQHGGIDPSTFRNNLNAIITALRGADFAPAPYPPILLAMHAARGDGPFDFAWADYVDEAHAIARTDSQVAVLDLTLGPRMPDQADSPNWGLYADQVHPSNRGYSFLADRICDFISPR